MSHMNQMNPSFSQIFLSILITNQNSKFFRQNITSQFFTHVIWRIFPIVWISKVEFVTLFTFWVK